MRIAVAIPTYGRDDILVHTIKYVFQQNPAPDEILVIDQSESHTSEVQLLLDTWAAETKIRYLRQPDPGLPAARNRAIRETDCDILIFVDDDVEPAPGFVAAHRDVYISDRNVVAVAGRVIQSIGFNVPERSTPWPRVMDYRYFRLDGTERVRGVANFIGCNHSVLVSYARLLGGYDENYKGVALREESDLALRIYLRGGLIVFEPKAELTHFSAPSGGCRKKDAVDVTAALAITRFSWKFRRSLGYFVVGEIWHATRLLILNRSVLRSWYLIPQVLIKYFKGLGSATAVEYPANK